MIIPIFLLFKEIEAISADSLKSYTSKKGSQKSGPISDLKGRGRFTFYGWRAGGGDRVMAWTTKPLVYGGKNLSGPTTKKNFFHVCLP